MHYSMVILTFYVFNQKYPFWANFGTKNQNCQFKMKFGTWTNSNMHNSMVMLNFSVFNQKYPFWATFGSEKKLFSLS